MKTRIAIRRRAAVKFRRSARVVRDSGPAWAPRSAAAGSRRLFGRTPGDRVLSWRFFLKLLVLKADSSPFSFAAVCEMVPAKGSSHG